MAGQLLSDSRKSLFVRAAGILHPDLVESGFMQHRNPFAPFFTHLGQRVVHVPIVFEQVQRLLYGPPAHPLSRAVVVGLGKLDALTYAETLEEIRKGAGAAAVRCRELGVDTLALPVSGLARFNADVERTIEEIVCAAMLGLWRNKAFKSKEP